MQMKAMVIHKMKKKREKVRKMIQENVEIS